MGRAFSLDLRERIAAHQIEQEVHVRQQLA